MAKVKTFNAFCKKFEEIMKKNDERLKKEDYNYNYKTSRTRFIKKIMKEDITPYFQKQYIELEYHTEYFRIDHSWWTNEHPESINHIKLFDWNLIIAIEHENEPRDWTNEVAKLDFIKAPLRIVIGYAKNKHRDLDIDKLVEQWKLLKNKDSIEKEGEFGVILLNEIMEDNNKDPLDIRCYKLTKKGVEYKNKIYS